MGFDVSRLYSFFGQSKEYHVWIIYNMGEADRVLKS